MSKSDFKGFHNSFNAYCEWCETSTIKMSWGEWWENLPNEVSA